MCDLLLGLGNQLERVMRKRISMVLPKHSQFAHLLKGPLLQGGDPAVTLWDNPDMRAVDKVNPTPTDRLSIIYSVLEK